MTSLFLMDASARCVPIHLDRHDARRDLLASERGHEWLRAERHLVIE
jgi:hypothetical protein